MPRRPTRSRDMGKTLAGVVTVAVLAGAAGAAAASDPAEERRKLADARAKWARQHVRDYRFRLRLTCFCPERWPVTVVVRDGRPRGARAFQRHFDTVPAMFRQISRALRDERAGEVRARYDRRRGFPRFASIDRIKLAIDDEVSFTVDRFRVLRRR
jgi:hypothetical protein